MALITRHMRRLFTSILKINLTQTKIKNFLTPPSCVYIFQQAFPVLLK